MTDKEEREQVLETLTNMRDRMEAIQQINSSYSTPERINALNYAISSIKTDLKYDLLYEGNQIADADKMIAEDNSCEPNNSEIPTGSTAKNDLGVDCVSRQEVLRLLANSIGKTNTYLQTEVLKMPSVTPREPRKGHWISHRKHCEMNNLLPSGLGSYFWCSECDCGIDNKVFARENYNYCPNCGADMRVSNEM